MTLSRKIVVVGFALCTGLSACSGAQTPAPADPQPEPEPEHRTSEHQANVVALCDALEHSSEIPISCTFQFMGDEPTMVLRVPSKEVLEASIGEMRDHLVAPFCQSQNRAQQSSGVVFVVASAARHLSCRDRTLSDWVDLGTEDRQTMTITQACDGITRSSSNVTCELMDLDGVPSMVVGFDSHAGVESSVVDILRVTAASFCQSASQANVNAGLVLLKDRSLAKAYSCATGEASSWFSVRPRRKVPPRPAGQPGPTPAPSGRAMVAANGGWDLLRVK